MLTGAASAREAQLSSRGRNSSARGTINQWRTIPASTSTISRPAKARRVQRISVAANRMERAINGVRVNALGPAIGRHDRSGAGLAGNERNYDPR